MGSEESMMDVSFSTNAPFRLVLLVTTYSIMPRGGYRRSTPDAM